MPGLSITIQEEGTLIKPRIVVREGKLDRMAVADLLSETRTPDERLGDLSAQVAANNVGMQRIAQVAENYGWDSLLVTFGDLQQYSAQMMSSALRKFEGKHGKSIDYMESDGAGTWDIPISATIDIKDGSAKVDFTGTSRQVVGNINCPLASTLSAVYYVFIVLFGKDIPTNSGCWSVVDVIVEQGSLLNPTYPSPVSAGNVETSQRIVDVTLGAMASIVPDIVPAASQGTMNNLTIGGVDSRKDTTFSFYETIGGGSGARNGEDGSSGIHTHMTNTLNTPIESLESEYPLLVRRYSINRNTGGRGKWRGGDGIIREIELLADKCTISIQSERRSLHPWGLKTGEDGKTGKNSIFFEGREHPLQAKTTVIAPRGSIIRIETPGGGGYGPPPEVS